MVRRTAGSGRNTTPGNAPTVRGPVAVAAQVIRAPRRRIEFDAGQPGSWSRAANRRNLHPNAEYVERSTGYTYRTDQHGRVTSFSGRLQAGHGHRNSYQQRVSGRTDRDDDDAGGHLFAHIFRGPGEAVNLVPMDANLNGGAWRRMENAWARALDQGSTVEVHGTVHYDPTSTSRRPVRFDIAESVNGGPIERHRFRNRPGG